MRRRTAPYNQHARRILSQEAMRRSHRRGELLRLLPDGETVIPGSILLPANDTEPDDEPVAPPIV